MKHRIEVRVKNKEKVLDGREMKLPARLVHWLLGDGMKVLVITPGDTVEFTGREDGEADV